MMKSSEQQQQRAGSCTPPSPGSSQSRSSDTSQATVIPAVGQNKAETPDKWVQFQENDTMELSVEQLSKMRPEPVGEPASATISVAQIDVNTNQVETGHQPPPPSLPTQFENGKLVTSILPENEILPWVVPARFNAYKMPKTLISDELTVRDTHNFHRYILNEMPVEDYVTAMELLTNDYRFRAYTMCYRRLITFWFVLSLILLLAFLFSSREGGLFVFLMVLLWMFTVAIGLLVCLCVKKQINSGLHRCVKSANKVLMRHNLLIGVVDGGKLSCHKIGINFVYFRTSDCMSKIMQLISQNEQTVTVMQNGLNGASSQPHSGTAEIKAEDNNKTVAVDMERPESLLVERAKALILKYSQAYVKAIVKRTIRFPTRPLEGVSEFSPRHCTKSYCLCQYLQKYHFERKEKHWYERFF